MGKYAQLDGCKFGSIALTHRDGEEHSAGCALPKYRCKESDSTEMDLFDAPYIFDSVDLANNINVPSGCEDEK